MHSSNPTPFNFCTPDDALEVRNKLSFVKPPSDALLRYFNMFHLARSPSSLQFIRNLSFGFEFWMNFLPLYRDI
jgi:hypothetical protein